MHKLDILLPFHRNDTFLIEAIRSIIDSEFKDYRLILIDDTKKNLSKFDFEILVKNNINYIYKKTSGNIGYGYSLEIGTQYIEAPYVALMNSDDYCHPKRFLIQIDRLKDSDLNFCAMKKYSSTGRKIASVMGATFGPVYDPIFLLLGSYGANATWVMKSEWWLKNSFFDSYYGLDWRIALRSFAYSKISYTDLELYFYRSHKEQYSKNSRKWSQFDALYSEWCEFAKKYNVGSSTRELFDLIVLPEMANNSHPYETYCDFYKSILYQIKINKLNINEKDIRQLIARRMLIYALTHLNKSTTVVKIVSNNKVYLLMLIKDLIQNLLSKIHFRSKTFYAKHHKTDTI